MSDHPKEAERNLKRIYICDAIYLDVFRLLTPAKVGLELALVSDTFDAMVDTHFKYRKWTLGRLSLWLKNIHKSAEKILPFPQKPLPNSIVGFSSVHIGVITSDAMAFLQRISRLLKSDVCLELHSYGEYNWNIFATSGWPMLNLSAIIKIHFEQPSAFQHFRRLISPSILRDCSNLRMITFGYGHILQFLPDDNDVSSDGQVLCKWLHTPRADGQPKVLKIWWDVDEVTMDAFKATFLSATTSVSFIVHLLSITSVGQFELVNSLTREQLSYRKINNDVRNFWWIERSPIDKCAEQWAKWEREALDNGTRTNDWNVLGILS